MKDDTNTTSISGGAGSKVWNQQGGAGQQEGLRVRRRIGVFTVRGELGKKGKKN